MKNSLAQLVPAATVALAVPAYADDKATTVIETKVIADSDGNYRKKTDYEHTDINGTKVKTHVESKVKAKSDGGVTRSVKAETITDPNGLLNKTTTKSETKVETKADGTTEYYHQKKVDGTVVEEEQTSENTRR